MITMAQCFKSLMLITVTMVIQLEAKDADLQCGACHMLVDEISWSISQTDPKRTIQVGSFRIMPDGSQRLNEIPYKQSGVHISELLDSACTSPNDYYLSTDKLSGRKFYKRQTRRDGKPASLKDVSISKETTKMLKFACESIAEDFDEEITTAFKNKEDENYLHSVCVQATEICSKEQLYDVNPDMANENEGEDDDSEDDDSEDDDSEEDDSEEDDSEEDSDAMEGTEQIQNRSEL